jgi:IS605 OrfB family transposase
MKVVRGYRTELDPTTEQYVLLCQCAGASRFAYNYGLARKQEAYRNRQPAPYANDLQRELTARKQEDLAWLQPLSKWIVQNALRDLDNAFRKCELKKQGKWRGKCGYPKFKNREKSRRRLARSHAKIASIRRDVSHKATSAIVAKTKPASMRPQVIVLEDLNIQGMLKNPKLSRASDDVGLYEFRRQIEYKARHTGVHVKFVSRWFPSSKTCHACSYVLEELDLAIREWTCPNCGACHDRDLNAAKVLAAQA